SLIKAKWIATSAQQERSSFDITLFPAAAIMSIVPSEEPAHDVGFGSSARGIGMDAPSSAMRAKSCWTKPASNPIHRKLVLTESVDSGSKSATLARRLFSTALSALAGEGFGGKAF